jgi:hypothetical protein
VIILGPFGKQDTLGPLRSDDAYADRPWQDFSEAEIRARSHRRIVLPLIHFVQIH